MKTLFNASDPEVATILAQLEHLRKIVNPVFLGICPVVTSEQIAALLETAHWASLRANEGRTTKVRITVAGLQELSGVVPISTSVSFDETQIAKLAPAVPARGCLLVDPASMKIWAISREQIAHQNTISLEIVRPGVVRVGIGPYRTYMVLAGRTATQVLATGNADLAHFIGRALCKSLPTDDVLETQAVHRETLALEEIARIVRTNGHGGALLVVPDCDDGWSASIASFGYRFTVIDSSIPNSIRGELKRNAESGAALEKLYQSDLPEAEKSVVASTIFQKDWVDRASIDAAARLASVDGAVVLTASAGVIGFGAKIESGSAPPATAWIGPGSGKQRVNACDLEQLGGMRHQSAARFVGANHNCAAIVISEDGPMSAMSWHTEWECVLVIKDVDTWC